MTYSPNYIRSNNTENKQPGSNLYKQTSCWIIWRVRGEKNNNKGLA